MALLLDGDTESRGLQIGDQIIFHLGMGPATGVEAKTSDGRQLFWVSDKSSPFRLWIFPVKLDEYLTDLARLLSQVAGLENLKTVQADDKIVIFEIIA